MSRKVKTATVEKLILSFSLGIVCTVLLQCALPEKPTAKETNYNCYRRHDAKITVYDPDEKAWFTYPGVQCLDLEYYLQRGEIKDEPQS